MTARQISLPALILIMMALALLSYPVIGLSSRIIADDYCTAVVGLRYSPWDGMLDWYRTWSGNYANFFVKSLIAPAQPAIHAVLPAALTGLLFLTAALLCYRIFRDIGLREPGKAALAFTPLLLFTAFTSAVSRQPLYWMGALIPYGFPAILVLFNIWLLLMLRDLRPAWQQGLIGISIILLVFLTAGFSETYATFQVAALLLALGGGTVYFQCEYKRVLLAVLACALVAASVGLLVSVLSPGNFARQVQLTVPYQSPGMMTLAVQVTVFTTLLFVAETFGIANFAFIYLATLAGLFWWYAPQDRALLKSLSPSRYLWRWGFAAGVTAFLLVAAMITPPVYGTGEVASRTLFMTRLVQLILFAFWGYLTAIGLARQNFPGRLAQRPVYRLVRLAVVLLLVFMPLAALVRQAILLPDASRYAAGWDARHAEILAAKARGEARIDVPPLAYDFEDYLELDKMQPESAANWVNDCASSYYGIAVFVEEG